VKAAAQATSAVERSARSNLHARTRALRVLFDATNMRPQQSGIRTYTLELAKALAAREDLSLHVVTSAPEEFLGIPRVELGEVSPRATRDPVLRAAWREARLQEHAKAASVDVVLSPVPELPLWRLDVPAVAVVHDVGPLVARNYYGRARWIRYELALKRVCARASAVVCVSRATLLALHAATGVAFERCRVISEGPQTLARPDRAVDLEHPYLLYVGSLYAHKNVETVLAAVAADEALPRVVVVGPASKGELARLARRVAELGLSGRVEHLGFVSPDELRELYRAAAALVQPSLYEGFCLPVLEAMAAGLPVIASDIPAIRELAGDAARLVENPLEASAWQAAIAQVATEPATGASLAERGLARAGRFSWDRAAEDFCGLFREIA
jgi:glycosyltransferase involved in cell wall biosynthesis